MVGSRERMKSIVNGTVRWPTAETLPLRAAAVTVFAALLLATAGAFDTEAVAFAPRLGYWLAIAAVSTTALLAVQPVLQGFAPAIPDLWLRLIGWSVLLLPLNTLAVLGCKLLFGGWPSIGGFLHLLPGMALILAALQLVLASFRTSSQPSPIVAEPAPVPPRETLARHLPLPLRTAAIEALEADDHYVRVHTSAGEAYVRMRLQDAIALVAPRDGVQPHRSWWVALDAVGALHRDGARTILKLKSGKRIPVSRSARPLLGPLFRDAR